jgi:AraC-like DNA-binding protein
VADPALSAFGFGAYAVAFRSIVESDVPTCANAVERLGEMLKDAQTGLGRRVTTILASLDQYRGFASTQAIASSLGLAPGTMTRELRAVSGLSFRDWRILLRVRSAVPRVAVSNEQIAQIAYQCGYEHPSQFDRDFSKSFGVSPRIFRRVVQADC